MQVVDIGILDEGSYKIMDLEESNRDLRHKGDLPVAKLQVAIWLCLEPFQELASSLKIKFRFLERSIT